MPTGYTADLMEKGQSFPVFALNCARAFGACVTMRDDDQNAPIPERFEPSDYSRKALAKAKREMSRLSRMKGGDRRAFGSKLKRAAIARHEEWLAREQVENERLDKMRAEVLGWTPPTSEHQGLKNFMLEQIDTSRNNTEYILGALQRFRAKSSEAYYADALASAEREIVYHTEEQAKEEKRVAGRNDWIRQLRESLKST